ncbi:MAG: histidinol-phosphatase [Treponema sp.]|jgi:histidinol-phosphatase (PHP family)|nr:histidinol-phosphatase [Treponema sp.]
MKLSCLHTHTNFCDGNDDIQTMCTYAHKKGLSSLGFSSHAPLPKESELESDWHIKLDKLDAYMDAVLKAKKEWKGRLNIYLGLEIDYIRGIMGPSDNRFKMLPLDYCIGSVHYVIPPKGKPFTVDGPFEEAAQGIQDGFDGDSKAYMHAYWDAVSSMIDHGGFDILGHIDLIKKNNQNEELFSLSSKEYLSGAERALDKLTGTSAVAEINTGGLIRGKTKDCYPSLPILQMMQSRNIPVTITADAHNAEHLAGYYDTAIKTLRESGYKSIQFFEGSPGGEAHWSSLPLENCLS